MLQKIKQELKAGRHLLQFGFLTAVGQFLPFDFDWEHFKNIQKSAFILRLLLFAAVTVLYGVFYSPILNALKRFKFTQTSFIAHLLVRTLANLWLVPRNWNAGGGHRNSCCLWMPPAYN